jgi:uncharacterized membrane protein
LAYKQPVLQGSVLHLSPFLLPEKQEQTGITGGNAELQSRGGEEEAMTKGRLEAFSDGVLAIILTIMVLELKVPQREGLEALRPLLPVFLSYVLSFIYVGIYWNNHHHLLHTVQHVNGNILWANLHLLFWLSLIPFVTGWHGGHHLSALPAALYGVVLFMAGFAYWILQKAILKKHGHDSPLAQAVGKEGKERASMLLYLIAVGLATVHPLFADAIYVFVALLWLVPDRRIERVLYR